MGDIENMIDENPFIGTIQKEFYKIMLRERKEKILDYSLEKLRNNYKGNLKIAEKQLAEKDIDLLKWVILLYSYV